MNHRIFPTAVACALLMAACSGPVMTGAAADTPNAAPLNPLPSIAAAQPTTTLNDGPRPSIVLGFAGDTSFTHHLHERDPFGDITAELSAPDVMLVNLETTIAEPDVGTAVDKQFVFKSPPESVALLSAAGIDAVQLANNHTLDFGRPAILRTLELLDEGGVAHAGAGSDPEAAYAPLYLDVSGWKIGVVSMARVPCDWSWTGENTRPEVAWTCDPFVDDGIAAVAEASQNADVVVVMVHWGIELDHCPQPYQSDLATGWVAAGADIVVGGHPHVLQGVERIDAAWLVNSTGNFAFPSAQEETARSAIFEFTIAEDGEISLQATPVWIPSGRPALATGDVAASILNDLSRWSSGYGFDEAGNAIPRDGAGDCG